MSYEIFDHISTRCPRLGGSVTFGYCRRLDNDLPCPRALDCFQLLFPVVDYFKAVLTRETFERIFFSQGRGRYEALLQRISEATSQRGPR